MARISTLQAAVQNMSWGFHQHRNESEVIRASYRNTNDNTGTE